MNITYNCHSISEFNQHIAFEFNNIENVELKIILALSDLLEGPKEYEENFINNSLAYLKEHYLLTKSVWKVLLKLNEELPHFIDELSIGEMGFGMENKSHRQYGIKEFFKLINLLYQNFTMEETINYIGLFIRGFDTKKHVFSIENLRNHSQYLKSIKSEDSINDNEITYFRHRFFKHNQTTEIMKNTSQAYLLYLEPITEKNEMCLKYCLDNISSLLMCAPKDSVNSLIKIYTAYRKYTNEKFITSKGLIEIKNKKIEEKDNIIITRLLLELDNMMIYNSMQEKITICLLKLLNSYKNNIKQGMNKLNDIKDCIGKRKNIEILKQLYVENKLNLKNLLTLNNSWEQADVIRGKNIKYKDYDIDLQIGNYYFYQIKDSHQLHEEGQCQSHCVYTYDKDCIDENAIIISMQDKQSNRVSTIRLKKENKALMFFKQKKIWSLAENRRRYNKNCSIEEKKVVNTYFKNIKDNLR